MWGGHVECNVGLWNLIRLLTVYPLGKHKNVAFFVGWFRFAFKLCHGLVFISVYGLGSVHSFKSTHEYLYSLNSYNLMYQSHSTESIKSIYPMFACRCNRLLWSCESCKLIIFLFTFFALLLYLWNHYQVVKWTNQ